MYSDMAEHDVPVCGDAEPRICQLPPGVHKSSCVENMLLVEYEPVLIKLK